MPSEWSVPPFSGLERDGHVWGRGALDMKGQVAAEAVAFATLAREGWSGAGDLVYCAVADEEVGDGWGLPWMIEHHPDLVRADYVVNEGGGERVTHGSRVAYTIGVGEKQCSAFADHDARPQRARLGAGRLRQRPPQADPGARADRPHDAAVARPARAAHLPALDRRGRRRSAQGDGGRAGAQSAPGRDDRADARSHGRPDRHVGEHEDQRHPRPRPAALRLPHPAGHDAGRRRGRRPRGAGRARVRVRVHRARRRHHVVAGHAALRRDRGVPARDRARRDGRAGDLLRLHRQPLDAGRVRLGRLRVHADAHGPDAGRLARALRRRAHPARRPRSGGALLHPRRPDAGARHDRHGREGQAGRHGAPERHPGAQLRPLGGGGARRATAASSSRRAASPSCPR